MKPTDIKYSGSVPTMANAASAFTGLSVSSHANTLLDGTTSASWWYAVGYSAIAGFLGGSPTIDTFTSGYFRGAKSSSLYVKNAQTDSG